MTTEQAHGRMMKSRSSLRPRNGLFRNCAMSSESTTVHTTTTTTHSTVLSRIRSMGTPGKVSAPAGPM
jgi:hypothetical protein